MASEAGKKQPAQTLRIIARVIGTIFAAFLLAMVIGDAVDSILSESSKGINLEVLFIVVPVIIALAAFILCWWREFAGGIALVAAYLILSFSPSVHSLFYNAAPGFYYLMFFVSSPFLIAGILFIIASRLARRRMT
jgi:hypothetical protein